MIITEIYPGQGLGNQLWCYVVTRVIAKDNGYDFGIMSPENFKCNDFLNLDFGKTVVGGNGPAGGPPHTLPDGIKYYYNERRISLPQNANWDLRTYDPNLITIPDHTKIDGVMQDEQYILHHKAEIKEWLKVKTEVECYDYASDDICVINFRGGEYVNHPDLFLKQKYWDDAIKQMRKINPNFRFIVITDDIKAAQPFFPKFDVLHFSIAKDYVIIKNAHYLILSNSSFAWFPAWLNDTLKYCIAPKYWAAHNTSNGFWSCSYNITTGWHYLDQAGTLFDYETCIAELKTYQSQHQEYYLQPKIENNFLVISNYYNDLSWVPDYTDDYLIYDQSDHTIYPPKLDAEKVIKSPHLGNNIRDYCTYIIDHYDQLPKRMIFATGNIFPKYVSREYFNRIMNNVWFTPIEEYTRHKENWPTCFFSSDGGFCEVNNSWYLKLANDYHPTKYFHDYNDFLKFCFKNPVLPRYIRFAPGANYIVPKEQIRKLPKVFYENLRLFVSHNTRPQSSQSSIPGESHIIERALYTLWMSNFTLNEAMLHPLKSDFIPPSYPPAQLSSNQTWIDKLKNIL